MAPPTGSLLSKFLLVLVLMRSFSSSSSVISRKELRTTDADQTVIQLDLDHSFQPNRIDPSRVLQVSWRPRVFLYNKFLTYEECDHLVSLAQDEKERTSNDVRNRLLTSSETHLNIKDNVVSRIEERISAWTFLPKENSKPMQVMHYELEEAAHHSDYFGNKSSLSEPLLATVILFLSNVTRGGDIIFPESEMRSKAWSDCTKGIDVLRPIKGNAVLFFSLNLKASPDKSSSHTRCPVIEGDMWCATKYFHLKDINRKQVSSDDVSECEDEDENCPQWAAVGECERNSVYMIGSPDYYGTCRKSCKAC